MKVRKLELADYGKFIRFERGNLLNLWVKHETNNITKVKELFIWAAV